LLRVGRAKTARREKLTDHDPWEFGNGTRFDGDAMFIDSLLNQGPGPSLEQWLRFTDNREELLAQDIVNASTPGYQQKDLSVTAFEKSLAAKQQEADSSVPGTTDFKDIPLEDEKSGGILFHDGNNRSMEQLMTDQAKNALMHNLAVELLRRQFATLDMALKEKPA
jgi:flagellar basal-body rod protein FlgB